LGPCSAAEGCDAVVFVIAAGFYRILPGIGLLTRSTSQASAAQWIQQLRILPSTAFPAQKTEETGKFAGFRDLRHNSDSNYLKKHLGL
jgi:hypothetical protein